MYNKRRVIFCTYSSVYSSIVLQELIDDECIDVVAIINSTRVLHPEYGQVRGAIEQIRLSGLRYSSYLFFITDFFSWLQPVLKLSRNHLKTVHDLAKQYKIPILDTRDINQQDSIEFIANTNPEYLLAAHFNQLVKSELLNTPEMECINIHPSLLPRYKGVDPVFFAQLNDENNFGVTVHKMAESFDTGEVLSQDLFDFSSSKSTLFINKRVFLEGAKLAIKWICHEENKTVKQQQMNANYDSWPLSEQVRCFNRKGKRLFSISELWK